MTTHTIDTTTNIAGVPPAPPEAHLRAGVNDEGKRVIREEQYQRLGKVRKEIGLSTYALEELGDQSQEVRSLLDQAQKLIHEAMGLIG